MYSESDLNGAVEAGVLSPDAAEALRAHIARQRATPVVDEEHFRLLTGFNDIFVSVALALLLVSLAWIGGTILTPLGGLGVAGAAWFLAEYFTARRRMALPSILLLLAFVGGVARHESIPFDDGDPCTVDRCDALLGVLNEPVDVDDVAYFMSEWYLMVLCCLLMKISLSMRMRHRPDAG